MENDIFENNRNALQRYNSDLYELLLNEQYESLDTGNAMIESAKCGRQIVAYQANGKKIYLNSKYNPTDEAKRFMESYFSVPDEAVVTMFGLANGEFVRAILNHNTKKIRCLVFEPDVSIFIQVMQHIDITDVLNDERVRLVVYGLNTSVFEKTLFDLIQSYNRRTSEHIELPKYKDIFPDIFEESMKIIREQYQRLGVESLTTRTYGKRVCENNLYNICHLCGASCADDYVGRFPEGMPAVVVGAGPSLEKNISLLTKIKNKALIAVADRAIDYVTALGIVPDVVFSIDFEKPVELFQGKDINKIPFVADMDFNHEVLDYLKPKQLIFYTSDSITWGRIFEQAGCRINEIDTGGSVSTLAIATLISWGIKNIILIGQDLALTDNKKYAGGQCTEISDNNGNYIMVDSIEGGTVLTRQDLYQYIKWIEGLAERFPDVKVIDATEGGAKKKNTKIMSFEAAIDEYCRHEFDVSDIWANAPRHFEGENKGLILDTFLNMKNNIKNLKQDVSQVIADCRCAASMLEKRDFNKMELNRINNAMGQFDETLISMDECSLYLRCVADAEYELADDMYIEERDDIGEAIRLYKKSEKYYQAIADSIPWMLDTVEKCIHRLNG